MIDFTEFIVSELVLLLISSFISIWLLLKHYLNCFQPIIQNRIIQLLLMIPLNGLISMIFIAVPEFAGIASFLRTLFLGLTIFTFDRFFLSCLQAPSDQDFLVVTFMDPSIYSNQITRFFCINCDTDYTRGVAFVKFCRIGLIQSSILLPTISLCFLILDYLTFSPVFSSTNTFLLIFLLLRLVLYVVTVLSALWSTLSFLLLYLSLRNHFHSLSPLAIFSSFFSLSLGLFYWQSLIFVLVGHYFFPESSSSSTTSTSSSSSNSPVLLSYLDLFSVYLEQPFFYHPLLNFYQEFVLMVELAVLSIALYFVFPVQYFDPSSPTFSLLFPITDSSSTSSSLYSPPLLSVDCREERATEKGRSGSGRGGRGRTRLGFRDLEASSSDSNSSPLNHDLVHTPSTNKTHSTVGRTPPYQDYTFLKKQRHNLRRQLWGRSPSLSSHSPSLASHPSSSLINEEIEEIQFSQLTKEKEKEITQRKDEEEEEEEVKEEEESGRPLLSSSSHSVRQSRPPPQIPSAHGFDSSSFKRLSLSSLSSSPSSPSLSSLSSKTHQEIIPPQQPQHFKNSKKKTVHFEGLVEGEEEKEGGEKVPLIISASSSPNSSTSGGWTKVSINPGSNSKSWVKVMSLPSEIQPNQTRK